MSGYTQRNVRLLNDISVAPQDSLNGLVLLHPHLNLLEIGHTIVRKDYTEMDSFQILSGGPSGHEPMCAGYVGKGMLSAAIQGEVFKSPTTYEIYNVIKELAFRNDFGVLLIIQNASYCSLNFAVAVEKARTDGLKVELLITNDDCSEALMPHKSDQGQGLTGTVITMKVAGAMAEGFAASLPEALAFISEMQNDMSTVLYILKPCTLVVESKCVCTDVFGTFGGGLREPKTSKHKIKCLSSNYVVGEIMKELSKDILFTSGLSYIVMINNMCCSALEENILVSELLKHFISLDVEVKRIYVGTFMTAVDLQGFTVTVLKSSDKLVEYLDYPTEAPSWKMRTFGVDATLQKSIKPRIRLMNYPRIVPAGPSLNAREANIVFLVMQFACDALISCRRQLDIMDSEFGDGDVGHRLEIVANTILKGLNEQEINTTNMFAFFKMLSRITDTINGSMGAIYSIIFESCANTFSVCEVSSEINELTWIECLENAVIALKSYTSIEDPWSNMLAPLIACTTTLQEKIVLEQVPVLEAFECAVAEAETAVGATTRKTYPDPGAHAVGIWMRAVYEGVKYRCQF